MHVTPTDFRDLGRRGVMDIGQRGHFGCWRAGHSDLRAYQESSKQTLRIPFFCAHRWMESESFCTNFT